MERKPKIVIAGTRYFGAAVLSEIVRLGIADVAAVSAPIGDRLEKRAREIGISVIPAGCLNLSALPRDLDIGIAAHCHDFIGRDMRYAAKFGWIGFHPSLLPRHRGRDAVEWAVRMGDAVSGGTVYYLDGGVDTGDIISQRFIHIGRGETAAQIWRDRLCDMGVEMICEAISQVWGGSAKREPQDNRYATFEPQILAQRLHRPDAIMIPEICGT